MGRNIDYFIYDGKYEWNTKSEYIILLFDIFLCFFVRVLLSNGIYYDVICKLLVVFAFCVLQYKGVRRFSTFCQAFRNQPKVMSTQHPTQTVAQPSNTSTMDVDDTMSQHIDTLVNPTNTHHIKTPNKYTHKINEVKTNSTSNTTEVHRILSMTPPPPTSLPPSPNLAEFTQSMVVPNRKSLKTLTVITGDSTNKMLNINIGRSARTELTHTRTHSAHGQYDMSAFPDIYEQDFVNSAPATDDHHYSYSSLTSADYHHQHSIKHFNPYNHEGSTHLQLPLTHMYPINPLGISSPLPMSSEDEGMNAYTNIYMYANVFVCRMCECCSNSIFSPKPFNNQSNTKHDQIRIR